MDDRPGLTARVSAFLHHHFLWFLSGAYVLAGIAPSPGLWLRGLHLGDLVGVGQHLRVTLPSVMLALLLFNAGLGVQTERLRNLTRRPVILLAGLLGNLAVP